MAEKNPVTQEGYDELQTEYQKLISEIRPEVIEDLKAARAQGDLSENADYDAARDRQARVEARIRELETILNNVEIIDDETSKKRGKLVKLGSRVRIFDLDIKEEEVFTIVGSVEADPLNGKLSNVSPLAEAIMDHKVNDVVTVEVDDPYDVKILEIN